LCRGIFGLSTCDKSHTDPVPRLLTA
jgi:hypothetical protein